MILTRTLVTEPWLQRIFASSRLRSKESLCGQGCCLTWSVASSHRDLQLQACERFKLLAQMRRLDTEEKVMEGMGMQGDWNDNGSDDFDPREGFGEEQCIEPR